MSDDLIIRGLTATTTDGNPLLTSIDHHFKAGTLTLVLGRSGTGKTMLLELLSGLREPSSGQVILGSEPLWTDSYARSKPNRQVLLRLGTAFQHPEQQLFAHTIKEEFLYTLRPYKLSQAESNQRIQEAMGLFPGELGSWLERDPFQLSGGQQRRLSLALLQAAAPTWLLLDEPTAGMDAAGMSLLCEQLKKRKDEGRGTIIVTHEPEAFLPLADSVLILNANCFWQGSPSELAEQTLIWREAGLAPPVQLETLGLLRAAGFAVSVASLPNASATANSIRVGWAAEAARGPHDTHSRLDADMTWACPPQAEPDAQQLARHIEGKPHQSPALLNPIHSHAPNIELAAERAGFKNRDPRAVWLAYMLISPGILAQSHWIGWIAAFMVMLLVIRVARIPLIECLKPAAGLIGFTLIASVLSGLTVAGTEIPLSGNEEHSLIWILPYGLLFALSPAVETFFRLSILVMIMLIGFVLLVGINHLRLKRGLEQGLHLLKRIRIPVAPFAWTASLIIRFMPMIIDEWQRFARIAAARGKYPLRPGHIPILRMRMTLIPMLASLLRLGESLSLILIVRGVGRGDSEPTIAYRLRFNRYDFLLIAGAASILIALLLINDQALAIKHG